MAILTNATGEHGICWLERYGSDDLIEREKRFRRIEQRDRYIEKRIEKGVFYGEKYTWSIDYGQEGRQEYPDLVEIEMPWA